MKNVSQGRGKEYLLFLKQIGKKGYVFHADGRTPIHFACANGDKESLEKMWTS